MTPISNELLTELVEISEILNTALHPTGSRVISPETCEEDSDWDYYLRGGREALDLLLSKGFEFRNGAYYPSKTQCLYRWVGGELLNIIVCTTPEEFSLWHNTTFEALSAGLTSRESRLEFFAEARARVAPVEPKSLGGLI